MPERIKFDLCKCNWQDCAEIQEQIARYCFESGKSHPQLGFLTIANEHELLRKSMLRHLQMDPALPVKIRIARHHFHPDRMALYGNKAWALEFDGEQKILKKLNGTREWKQMQKLLEKEEAAKFGIQDDSEKVARKDKKSGYICAPIFSRNAVRIALRALSDPSSRSRHQKRRHGESMVDLIQEQSSEIVLPAKEVPLLPTLTTEPSGANDISNNDDTPRRPLLATFHMSDPATWAVPPTTLSSIINAETQKHIKIDNDNKINLEPSHLRQSMVFRSALLLYAKAGRNTLLNSGHEKDGTGRSDYKRDFLFEGVRFGWATIDRCWKREQKKVVRDTRLTGESAHPDQWNKMSAKLVKDVFDPDTLREILCHIWTTIELANEKCDFLWSSSTKANNDAKQILSYIPELKKKFLKLMRSSKLDENLLLQVQAARSDVYCLEYLCHMSIIYLDNLMYKFRRLTKDNIDDIQKTLQASMDYFGRWHDYVQQVKSQLDKSQLKSKKWQKWFLAPQSYLNWRTGICGFLLYCRLVWKAQEESNIEKRCYIPALHSNTSVLEAYFSLVRANKGDTPLKYAGMVGTLDSRNQMVALESNPMYDANDQVTESPAKHMGSLLDRKDSERKEKLNEWLGVRKARSRSLAITFADRPLTSNWDGRSKTSSGLRQVFMYMCLEMCDNFTNYFVDNSIFLQYALLSVGGPLETYFKGLLTIKKKEDETAVNDACKYILNEIVKGCGGLAARRGSPDRSFLVLLSRLQTDNLKMKCAVGRLPKQLQSEKPNIFHRLIVGFLGEFFQVRFITTLRMLKEKGHLELGGHSINDLLEYEQRRQDRVDSRPVPLEEIPSADEMARNVHKFVGYAVAYVKNAIESDAQADCYPDSAIFDCILNAMTTRSEDLVKKLLTADCDVKSMYPKLVHLKSVGKLKNGKERILISERFFDFGRTLLQNLQKFVNDKAIVESGEDFPKRALEHLMKSKALWDKFHMVARESMVESQDPAILELNAVNINHDVNDLYEALIRRAHIAYCGCFAKTLKETKTSRQNAKRSDHMAFRDGLKASCGPNKTAKIEVISKPAE